MGGSGDAAKKTQEQIAIERRQRMHEEDLEAKARRSRGEYVLLFYTTILLTVRKYHCRSYHTAQFTSN